MKREKESGILYVAEKDKGNREEIILFLEKNGYTRTESELRSRKEIIDGFLPLSVDLGGKKYGMMGNVTCAAAAASSHTLITKAELFGRVQL